ncbi:MAG: DNA mismatch repair protein MutS [Deltaproteobacteria bacterium]|nr:DNA mismatch repair protein MutS [Deltaproteobacteria bacterium]
MTPDAATHYARRREAAGLEVERLRVRSSAISLARFVAFVAIVALGLAARFAGLGSAGWIGAAVAAVAFVVLVLVHDRVLERKRRAEASVAWADEGLARLRGQFACDPRAGEPEPDDAHPYAGDLDVVGRGSLLQSIDTTRTRDGRALLASWLLEPASAAEVQIRQQCARDLAPRVELREVFAVEGALVAEEPPDVAPLLRWAREGSPFAPSALLRATVWVLPAITVGLLAFGGSLPLPRATWVATLLLQIVISARHRTAIAPAILAASEHQAGLSRFARMFATLEGATLDAPPLQALRASVAEGPASVEIARLGRIVGFLDARRNEVFRLLIGPVLMWDLHCAIALERWRVRAGLRFDQHLATLARFEALCALAARAFERPDDAWPEVVGPPENDEVAFHARALGHPLIAPAKVVRNDVDLDAAGTVLLVTGSNMSGKSTLLRAMGTNVVLALAGAPVRASSLRTTSFAVWTSMRVRDSLSAGVSHFLAELRRLKAVADAADAASAGARPTLFLLDEILHGTNSRERHLGAQAIVRRLVTRRACGAISTHDLALGALETELPGKVRNVHFREQVEEVEGVETMTFDYRLREGVVTSSNALRLMRIVGLDV